MACRLCVSGYFHLKNCYVSILRPTVGDFEVLERDIGYNKQLDVRLRRISEPWQLYFSS